MADNRGHLFARPDAPHRVHDLLLVAAWAAGDATGADRDRADALVAACNECAALARDLREIQRATPSLPAPARQRDFRLTAEDARRLRPRGLRGFVVVVTNPGLARARPLAAGVTMLGLAGLLATSISFGGPAAVVPSAGDATRQSAPEAPGAPAGAVPAASGNEMFTVTAAPESTAGANSVPGDTSNDGSGAAGGQGGTATGMPIARASVAPSEAPRDIAMPAPESPSATTDSAFDARPAIAIVSLVLVVLGIGLFIAAGRQRRRA